MLNVLQEAEMSLSSLAFTTEDRSSVMLISGDCMTVFIDTGTIAFYRPASAESRGSRMLPNNDTKIFNSVLMNNFDAARYFVRYLAEKAGLQYEEIYRGNDRIMFRFLRTSSIH